MRRKLMLYGRPEVFIFSILLSGLCGVLMLAYNLRATGKQKVVLLLVITTLIADAIMYKLIGSVTDNSLPRLLIPNLVAGTILWYPVWNTFIGLQSGEYNAKPVWLPVVIAILVYGSLYLLNMLAP